MYPHGGNRGNNHWRPVSSMLISELNWRCDPHLVLKGNIRINNVLSPNIFSN